MSWSGLAVNQAVSWADLLDAVNTGVLGTGGTTITSSNQCIYKSLATITNYVNINTSYSPYSSRSSTDLLLKGDFQSAAYYTYHLSTSVVNGAGACSNQGGTITYYSVSSTLANGVYLFSNTALSSYATGPIYVSDGNNSWYLAGGAIPLASQAACSN